MSQSSPSSTRTSQLRAVRNWNDRVAWEKFHRKYEPFLRRICRSLRLDQQSANEICQQTWIEVATRVRTFTYDPSRSFRGWLRVVCKNKALNYIEKLKKNPVLSLEPHDEARPNGPIGAFDGDVEDEGEPIVSIWVRRAQEVQAAVRARTEPRTWEAFWLLAVLGRDLEETVTDLGMSHAAAYKAKERVAKRLRDEAQRRYGNEM